MVPYYAERRALMIRRDVEQNSGQLEAAFAALAGERIGALVLGPATQGREDLIRRATALGIDPHPLYHWQGVSVHVLLARRRQSIHNIIETGYDALVWEPGVELPAAQMAGAWLETQDLRSYQRQVFSAMRPQPVRFFPPSARSSTAAAVCRGLGRTPSPGWSTGCRRAGIPCGQRHTFPRKHTTPPCRRIKAPMGWKSL